MLTELLSMAAASQCGPLIAVTSVPGTVIGQGDFQMIIRMNL